MTSLGRRSRLGALAVSALVLVLALACPLSGTAFAYSVGPPPPSPPIGVTDSATVAQGGVVTVNVLANDTGLLGYQGPGQPDSQDFVNIAEGAGYGGAVVNPVDQEVTYSPVSGFSGTDAFDYLVCNANGCSADTQVNVTVTAVAQPGIARNEQMVTTAGQPVSYNLVANDTGPDAGTVSFQGTTQPANGSVSCSATYPGTCTYTPGPGFTGTDPFTYSVVDGTGTVLYATVTVYVDPAVLTGPGFTTLAQQSATTSTAALPAAPSLAGAFVSSPSDEVNLSWGSVTGATAYRVQRQEGTGTWVTLGLFSSSILSFPDTLIGPATAYNYRAETEIGRWVSVPSSVVTVVTPSAAAWQTGTDDFLSAPTSLAGSAQYNPTLGAVLTWTPSTSGASGYDIYRADMAGSVYAYVNGGASSTYTDPYVLLNGSYTYTVAAVGTSGGVSVPSASVTVNLTLPPPAAPIVSHILTTSATFSWNQVASATSYTLSGAGAGCTTSSTACSVFGLTPGTQYTVSLVATNGSQTSPSSPTVTFTTLQQPVEVSFSCNGSSSCTNAGSAQTWTVPAGVTSISTVVGGGGGGGGSGEGGPGATVSGTMAVTPGEILSIYVGQTGQVDGSGGWGYHSGGSSMFLLSYLGSGSAGGSSAVVAGSTLVAEAGGGGGYAYGTTGGVAVGGSGGQPTATSGGAGSFYNSNYGGWGYAYGGAGATQSAGGAGGSYSGPCNVCAYGYSGSFGGTATSQNGANSTSAGVAGNWPTYGAQSGSGGGGYAGGGSGGVIGLPAAYDNAGGAGGGGSSWYSPSYMSGVSYGVGAGWAGGVTITYTP